MKQKLILFILFTVGILLGEDFSEIRTVSMPASPYKHKSCFVVNLESGKLSQIKDDGMPYTLLLTAIKKRGHLVYFKNDTIWVPNVPWKIVTIPDKHKLLKSELPKLEYEKKHPVRIEECKGKFILIRLLPDPDKYALCRIEHISYQTPHIVTISYIVLDIENKAKRQSAVKNFFNFQDSQDIFRTLIMNRQERGNVTIFDSSTVKVKSLKIPEFNAKNDDEETKLFLNFLKNANTALTFKSTLIFPFGKTVRVSEKDLDVLKTESATELLKKSSEKYYFKDLKKGDILLCQSEKKIFIVMPLLINNNRCELKVALLQNEKLTKQQRHIILYWKNLLIKEEKAGQIVLLDMNNNQNINQRPLKEKAIAYDENIFPKTKKEKEFVIELIKKNRLGELKKVFKGKTLNLNYNLKHEGTPLNVAIYRNNLKMMEFLLQNGAEPNYKEDSGFTPLHVAAYYGCYKAFCLLLKYGGDCEIKNDNNKSTLELALDYFKDNRTSDYDKIISIIRHTSKITLSIAMKMKNTATLKQLLKEKKYSPDELNKYNSAGYTLLQRSAMKGETEISKLLLDAGSDPALLSADCNIYTALDLAAGYGHIETVSLFLQPEYKNKIPAPLLIKAFNTGISLYLYEGELKNTETIRYRLIELFMKAGVPYHIKKEIEYKAQYKDDKCTLTIPSPFETVIRVAKTKKTIDLFLEKGLKLPFYAACKWGDAKRVQELLNSGEEITKECVMQAVENNRKEILAILIDRKCRINYNDHMSMYSEPIAMAVHKGYYKITDMLIKAGAEVNPEDQEDDCGIVCSYVYQALKYKKYKIAELLLKNGAKIDMIDHMSEGKYKWQETMFDKFKDDSKAIALLKKYGREKYLKHLRPPIPSLKKMLEVLKNKK